MKRTLLALLTVLLGTVLIPGGGSRCRHPSSRSTLAARIAPAWSPGVASSRTVSSKGISAAIPGAIVYSATPVRIQAPTPSSGSSGLPRAKAASSDVL